MGDLVSNTLERKLNANATEPMHPTTSKEPVPVSSKRARAMATINASIAAAQAPPPIEDNTNQAGKALDDLAPPPSAATKEQKEEAAAREAARSRLTKEQEDILKAQEKLLGKEEADRLRREQEEHAAKSALVKNAELTVKNAKGIIHGADVGIGSLPQPGSIIFPLVVLLLFFFILIKVGAYSRLQWLWLVLTNNAQVGARQVAITTTETPETGRYNTTTGQGGSNDVVASSAIFYPLLPANGMYSPNGSY